VQGERKKLEIIKWAHDRFYEGGFHATGIDSLMAGSGISKRTLYKYFPCKEDLIEAVLEHYGSGIAVTLFDPVMAASDDPRGQILAFFDIRKAMLDECPTRGCLAIKASQEFAGKHGGIAAYGKRAIAEVERRFIGMCERARFAHPSRLGKQINILFQGALLLAHLTGESSPFVAARAAASALLESAEVAPSRSHKKPARAS
jgi:AcrR family transcriptional regulator